MFALILMAAVAQGDRADTIYFGGDIVTVDPSHPSAEALAVKDGRILAVGKHAAVMTTRGGETVVVDLKGKALLPGFLDGHSHFINALSVATEANVFAPPFGPGDSIEHICDAVAELIESQSVPKGELVLAYGYDGDQVLDGREMTAADLDARFPDHPVVVQHVSLHGGVLNSKAFEYYNIGADTPTPAGGIILRKERSSEPAGLVMETAWLPIFSRLPHPEGDALMDALEQGQMLERPRGSRRHRREHRTCSTSRFFRRVRAKRGSSSTSSPIRSSPTSRTSSRSRRWSPSAGTTEGSSWAV